MNCKPGDLAVMVRSCSGNEGVILRCIRLATSSEIDANRFVSWSPVWVVDRKLKATNGKMASLALDAYLRPIRMNEGEDETLTWAGKPEQVTA